MATIISSNDANAWADHQKINITTLDTDLEAQIVAQVFGAVSERYSTNTWLNSSTTPVIIRSIIAMFYVGRFFDRTYSTDTEPGLYGERLLVDAQKLLNGVITGNVVVIDPTTTLVIEETVAQIASYAPELYDTEPKFSMDKDW